MGFEETARVAHEVNRIYCESLGDTSQPKWEDAPEWQRNSAIDGVEFLTNYEEALPSASHENWMRDKIKAGWIKGNIKDPEKKIHPCLVPFDDLPVAQQLKDRFFHAVVRSMGG